MDIIIRKALRNDAPSIAGLIRSLGYFTQMNNEEAESTGLRVARHLELCNADSSHSVYVAESPLGELLGYCSVHWIPDFILTGPEGYVSELFIRESSRGKGIGSELLKVVEAEAKGRGCSRLMLLNLKNRESYQRGFYPKHGWEEREEVANFVYKISD